MNATKMRTHGCGDIRSGHNGQRVTLCGWTQRCRSLGGLAFIALRDRSGIVQVIVEDTAAALLKKAASIKNEYVLRVTGRVRLRGERDINPDMKTGEVEVVAEDIEILSAAETLPFPVDDQVEVSDELRMKYRYLDIRKPGMQQSLQMRHKATQAARNFLSNEGFVEIETPILSKSTPEGARDYLVPSRTFPGSFFALPQSPQLYKQLLMVAGMDRYFQIARCFRDEALRADRQPEFTQIDLEMSFVTPEDVMDVNERMIAAIFKEVLGVEIPVPLERITWADAMDRYGSDKPDTRFGLEIKDVSDAAQASGFTVFESALSAGGCVKAVVVPGAAGRFPRKQIDALTDVVKLYKAKGLAYALWGEGEIKSPIMKFFHQEHFIRLLESAGASARDAVFFVADASRHVAVNAMGQLRLELGRRLELIDENRYDVLWVTEFPLLEYDEEEGRYFAMHHPFTSPMPEDIDKMKSDPGSVRAQAYDMVVNGMELGGGSVRIHESRLQQLMFETLGFTPEEVQDQFGFLLNAFRYGTPPHGGCAFGMDRLAMILSGGQSIRDVIAFPKAQNASCLMMQAPAKVRESQLEELCIAVTCRDEASE